MFGSFSRDATEFVGAALPPSIKTDIMTTLLFFCVLFKKCIAIQFQSTVIFIFSEIWRKNGAQWWWGLGIYKDSQIFLKYSC